MAKKDDYRTHMKTLRNQFVTNTPQLAQEATQRITHALLDFIQTTYPVETSPWIAGYWPMGSEVDTRPLLYGLMSKGYKILLPKVESSDPFLSFCPWDLTTDLKKNDLGFFYPTTASCQEWPTLLLTPLLAFDARGHRLGYGRGYYDQTLAYFSKKDLTLRTLGVAYEIQRVDELPIERHDVRLNSLVTEKGLYRFSQ